MGVSRDDIRKIAELAELSVDEAAAVELEAQLSRILDYVAQLREVSESAVGAADTRAARLRRDEVAPDPLRSPPSAWAPAMKQGLFVVPRLGELDRGEDAP
jgi:aspartyl-tRNA(Asn)/glutamyl-tRNA(Gln) amidotransferase subunit C